MTPKQLAQRARAEFRKSADPRVAVQQRVYFKKWEKLHFYGLKTPELRQIERELHGLVRKEWTCADAIALCEVLMPDRYLESKGLALMLLMRYRRRFEPDLLPRAKSWLERGLCDNWATTDHLATRILSSLIDKFEPLAASVESWDRSPNLWVRRSSAVAFVNLAREGRHLDRSYRIATVLEPDTHDLIHKACGWLLRECGKADAKRLEEHLLKHGSAIPRTTVRYAIERFSEAKRKHILETTRTR
ncbi:MAG TPA: DNA alkylation repair protein [Bryobacteraceae bacterium]|nr:DNA alkylation repair protein [Bryobacteraceae bacterium]